MEPPERPADPAVRHAYLRRIAVLFAPYRARLAGVLGLIVLSSALGSVPAFLIKEVFDTALPDRDLRLLNQVVAAMIAIAIVTGVLGVIQTLLSNQVGQRVMHDLRTSVYKHLQRLSLAFFTRTRTGEVQSRLANDIGGVQQVVTSTATSIVSNVTTVLATVVAMFVLDWRLTLFALALLPLFVWLTRRVGNQRRKVAKVRQESMADISSLVQESLSVSGILLGKTMGRADELATRFEDESARLADLEVRQPHDRPLDDGVDPDLVRGHAGARLSLRGPLCGRDLDRHRDRVHDPAGAALLPGRLAARRLARRADLARPLRPRLRVPRPAGRHRGGTRTLEIASRGDVAFDGVWFRYDDAAWTLQDVSFEVPAGRRQRSSGETGSGKTTAGYLVARLYDATRGRVTIDGVDVRELTFDVARATRSASSRRRRISSTRPCARTSASPAPTRPTRRSRRRRARPRSTG